DTASGIYGTDAPTNVSIGKGAYWIRVTYADDTQDPSIFRANCLDGCTQGAYIEMLSASSINASKVLKKIEIVFVYELVQAWDNWIGWWDDTPNFRCDLVLNFQ
ncbi:MAG: hypothetical protein IKC64_02255, partial [Clostridia bacterium]|nr:hypothetical protein [Clostridia bacterium]